MVFQSAAIVYFYFAIYTKCLCILNIFKKRFSFFRQNETFLFGRPPAEIRVIMKWERRFVFILSKQSITSPRSRLFRRPANILKATTKIAILRRRITEGHNFLKSPDQKKHVKWNEINSTNCYFWIIFSINNKILLTEKENYWNKKFREIDCTIQFHEFFSPGHF